MCTQRYDLCLTSQGSYHPILSSDVDSTILYGSPLQIIADSPILPELVHIILDSPQSALSGAAMGVLAVLALFPDGRQAVSQSGAAAPLVRCESLRSQKCVAKCH